MDKKKDIKLIRLERFIKHLSKSNTELSEILKIAPYNVSRVKNGQLSFVPYLKDFTKLGLNLNWLYTGDGDMLILSNVLEVKANQTKQNILNEIEDLESFIKNIKWRLKCQTK